MAAIIHRIITFIVILNLFHLTNAKKDRRIHQHRNPISDKRCQLKSSSILEQLAKKLCNHNSNTSMISSIYNKIR